MQRARTAKIHCINIQFNELGRAVRGRCGRFWGRHGGADIPLRRERARVLAIKNRDQLTSEEVEFGAMKMTGMQGDVGRVKMSKNFGPTPPIKARRSILIRFVLLAHPFR